MAVSFIETELQEECDGNMFAENCNKYHCVNCYHSIQNFDHFVHQTIVFLDPQNLIKLSGKINHREGVFVSALCELIKNYKYCKIT